MPQNDIGILRDCEPHGVKVLNIGLNGILILPDQTEREVVALSGSRRTESLWVRTTVFASGNSPVATMLLNLASIKDSYAPYSQEYAELYA